MEQKWLIHPIYLDVPMLISFAAAIQGGLSFETEITHETEADKSGTMKASGKFGLSSLFNNLFDLTAEAEMSGSIAGKTQQVRRELKSHTEASVAIMLYDQLVKNKYVTRPRDAAALSQVDPGTLVEVAGTLEKNAVDAVIDDIDAIILLSRLTSASDAPSPLQPAKPTQSKRQSGEKNPLKQIRDNLDEDRNRTPISNALLKCEVPFGAAVIVTLRRANLRDLTLTELHKNNVRVVGKVTRVLKEGQSMCAFENYGMALVSLDTVKQTFRDIGAAMPTAEFSDVEVKGPAVQILPLMVFV